MSKQFHMQIEEKLLEEVKNKAKELGLTISGYIRMTLINELKKGE